MGTVVISKSYSNQTKDYICLEMFSAVFYNKFSALVNIYSCSLHVHFNKGSCR